MGQPGGIAGGDDAGGPYLLLTTVSACGPKPTAQTNQTRKTGDTGKQIIPIAAGHIRAALASVEANLHNMLTLTQPRRAEPKITPNCARNTHNSRTKYARFGVEIRLELREK